MIQSDIPIHATQELLPVLRRPAENLHLDPVGRIDMKIIQGRLKRLANQLHVSLTWGAISLTMITLHASTDDVLP